MFTVVSSTCQMLDVRCQKFDVKQIIYQKKHSLSEQQNRIMKIKIQKLVDQYIRNLKKKDGCLMNFSRTLDRQMDGQTDGQTERCMDQWMDRLTDRQIYGWTDGWTDRQMDGWTDGQMDRQTDGETEIQASQINEEVKKEIFDFFWREKDERK